MHRSFGFGIQNTEIRDQNEEYRRAGAIVRRFGSLSTSVSDFAGSVHQASLKFPAVEQRILGDQMRRASKSICANIAEGFGKQRNSKAEFKRFLRIAIGSADEMRVWSRYGLDLGYLDEACWLRWRDEYHVIARMLQALRAKAGVSAN
jgi:four helix bundle protein